jgi:hypothetical protein
MEEVLKKDSKGNSVFQVVGETITRVQRADGETFSSGQKVWYTYKEGRRIKVEIEGFFWVVGEGVIYATLKRVGAVALENLQRLTTPTGKLVFFKSGFEGHT